MREARALMSVEAMSRPSIEERIRAALWFSERGFGVFSVWSTDPNGECRCPASSKTRGADGRCSAPGKHPIPPKGFLEATTDESRIRAMLSAGSEPNYGLLPPPGVFVLDVDDDGDGIVRLARLEALYGPLPPTLRTETRNGQHIFLRWPDGLPRPVHKMFGYVTRWGTGSQAGYVIGPRSVHASGFTYAPMVGAFEIAVLPDRWAQAAIAGDDTRVPVGKELPKRGGRHDWLRDRARYYRGVMDDRAVLKAAVMAENARLEEPKTEEEVDRAIGEVFEKFPVDEPETVDRRVSRRLRLDELDMLGLPAWGEFPQAPDEAAFGGILGQLVGNLAEGTDASLVGLLGSVLAVAGAVIPARAYFHREHTSSPFITLVGESSVGRKGTAMNRALDAFRHAVSVDTVNRLLLDGLNSGEGLVAAMAEREKFGQKLGLIFEEEFATTIASRTREGSTLDQRLRTAFDGGPLSNRKASDSRIVYPPYWVPALVAITPAELRARLETGALESGSANRWLYLPVVRRETEVSNRLPHFDDDLRMHIVELQRTTLSEPLYLTAEDEVAKVLAEYDDFLRRESTGLAMDLTRRYPIFAFRIALIHAVMDRSPRITTVHVKRALALTEYARRGVQWVFGDTIGNKDAAHLYRQLVEAGRLTKETITREVIRDPIRQQAAIDELLRLGRARRLTVQTGGRPRHELVPVSAQATPFFPFFHLHSNCHPEDDKRVEVMEVMEESAQATWKKGGRKVEERSDPETVSCHFYREHQTRHEYRDGRWMCPICEQPSPAA
jgi:hypothetical protein